MRWTFNDGGRAAAGYRGKTGDCGTRAIAIATGLPYQQVYDALNSREQSMNRRTRRRGSARTGVSKDVFRVFMRALGWTFTPTMQIGSGCTVHLRDGEIPMTGRLVVAVSRHWCAVVDGVIHDTHDPSRDGSRCVYGYWNK
jgi:hypothetical protein